MAAKLPTPSNFSLSLISCLGKRTWKACVCKRSRPSLVWDIAICGTVEDSTVGKKTLELLFVSCDIRFVRGPKLTVRLTLHSSISESELESGYLNVQSFSLAALPSGPSALHTDLIFPNQRDPAGLLAHRDTSLYHRCPSNRSRDRSVFCRVYISVYLPFEHTC